MEDGKEAGAASGCGETDYHVEKLEKGEGVEGALEGGDWVCD